MKLNYSHTRYAAYLGIFIQAIILNLPPVLFIIFKEDFGLSYDQLGGLTLFNFVVQISVDLLMIKLGNIISLRYQAIIANALSVIGLVMLSLLPQMMSGTPYIALLIAEFFMAIGAGMIEVGVSPLVSALPSSGKKAELPLLHSFYCWGHVFTCLLSTLFLFFFDRSLWYLLPLLWAIVPLIDLISFVFVPVLPLVSESARTPLKDILKNKVFLCGMLMMIFAGASEQSVAQWMSLFAEEALQLPKLFGDIFALCGFALMMALGRMLYGIFGARLDQRKALVVCGLLCTLSYVCLTLVPLPAVSLIAAMLTGVAVSLMWPSTLEMTTSRFPLGGVAMFSVMSVMGDIGCSVGPYSVGLISDLAEGDGIVSRICAAFSSFTSLSPESSALRLGIFAAILFPLGLFIASMLFIRFSNKHDSKKTSPENK